MISKNFHIQRGDDIETLPKNDAFQSFNLQSKWGALEALVLVDGESSGTAKNKFTAVVIQQCLTELRSLAKTSAKVETALEDTLRNVHAHLRNMRALDSSLDAQDVDVAIVAILKDKVAVALSGRLAALRVKAGQVDVLAGGRGAAGVFSRAASFQPEVAGSVSLGKGEDIVIASDGIHGGAPSAWRTIRKEELVETLKNERDLKRAAKRLVSYPLGRNVAEDISVVILRQAQADKKKPVWLLPAAIGLAIVAFFAYRSLSPQAAPDNGRVTVSEVTGLVFKVDPAQSSHENISGFDQISALYTVSTGSASSATMLVRSADLMLGPDSKVYFAQIESEAPERANQVILDVETQSWLLLKDGDGALTEGFVMRNGSNSFELVGASMPGQVVLVSRLGGLEFYCFLGVCSVNGETLSIGDKASVDSATSNVSTAGITEADKLELEQKCNCSLP
ncbi:MAG: protein phosphatase 2C family protein [Anaerolineales bacterium]|nr:protein phosphatase 2C family protein [Anaerolineales bacterium]